MCLNIKVKYMKILLTGGAGYIGSHVSHHLIDEGHELTVIDSLVTGHIELVPKKATFFKTDIDDKKKITKILRKHHFDAVIHLAGLIRVDESFKKPKKYYKFNYIKTKIFFKTCFDNGLKNIIFSSTASVYGNSSKKTISEKDRLIPQNPYAKSKLKVEQFLKKNSKKYKVNYIILRYFNVAGADHKLRTGLISKFSTHLIKVASEAAVGLRKKIIINGSDYDTVDGTAVRDYIHVSDLANIHLVVAKYLINNKKSEVFNCGYGVGFSVFEVISEFNKFLKNKIQFQYGPRRIGDSKHVVANIKKFQGKIKWKPKFNNLNYILRSSLKWEKKLHKSYKKI